MTPRLWVAAGASFLFVGIGVGVWQKATGQDALALTVLGGLVLGMGLAALRELVR